MTLQQEREQIAQRINSFQKALNSIDCRASTVFSTVVHGKATRVILEAYILDAKI